MGSFNEQQRLAEVDGEDRERCSEGGGGEGGVGEERFDVHCLYECFFTSCVQSDSHHNHVLYVKLFSFDDISLKKEGK